MLFRSRYVGVRPGWHMNKRHWISVYFNRDVSDEMVRKLVKKSYDMVVKHLNRKERERLL